MMTHLEEARDTRRATLVAVHARHVAPHLKVGPTRVVRDPLHNNHSVVTK